MLNEIKTIQETADLLFSEQEVEAALDKIAGQINHQLAELAQEFEEEEILKLIEQYIEMDRYENS